nr:TonB-dependent receptor [uncultured Rhodoferax sp.]
MKPMLGNRQAAGRACLTPLALALLSLPVSSYAQVATLPEVVVTSAPDGETAIPSYRASVSGAGALGTKELMDTPFSTSVATKEFIANQQATTLAEAFKADAAVSALNNSISGENSQIAIRGLPLDMLNGIKINGLNTVVWNTDLPLEHFEQVNLLKGLSGFMYGYGSPGGIADYQTKRAGNNPVSTAKVGYSTESQYVLHADIGRRFGEEERMGLRVNAVHEGGDTYLSSPIKRDSVSAAFDVRLTPTLQWSIDGLYQKRKVNSSLFAISLSDGVATPKPVNGRQALSQDFTYHQTEMGTIGSELHWNFAKDWDMNVGYRSMRQARTNYDSFLTVTNNAGNYTDSLYRWYSQQHSDAANLTVSGKVQTGSIGHDLTFGTSFQRGRRINGVNFGEDSLGTNNLYNVVTLVNRGKAVDQTLGEASNTREVGVFASDTIQWTPQWSSIIGLRHSDYAQNTYNYQTDGSLDKQYSKSAWSPTLALIWKPVATLAYYGSYVESLEQGGTAPTTAKNANTVFGPLKSKQYEIGVKKEGKGWSSEAALFRIERGLEYTNSSNIFVQEGGLVYQGLDLSARTELAHNWALMGSTVLMNSRNSSDDSTVNGKRARNVADVTASLQVEYKVPLMQGMVLSGGVRHVGEQALQSSNANMLGSYTLYDAAMRYVTKMNGKKVTFRANVANLTNTSYWMGSWGYGLIQGAPRTLNASAEFDF